MTPRDMTIAEIKYYLPDVDVLWDGKIYQAMVRGRKEKFATVSVWPLAGPWQFSWEAIHRAVNTGNPLRT